VEGKVRVVDELKSTLLEIRDPVAKSLYVKYLAERIGLAETAILEKIKTEEKNKSTRQQQPPWAGAEGALPDIVDGAIPSEMIRFERQIVTMMLNFPDIIEEIKKRHVLDYFVDHHLIQIGHLILKHSMTTQNDLAGFMNRIESVEQQKMIASLVISNETWDHGSCNRLLSQFLNVRQRRQNGLLNQIKSAQDNNDEALLFELLRKKQEQSLNRLR
jgi:DNA primase